MSAVEMQQRAAQFRQAYAKVQKEIGKVIVGHADIVHGVLTCLFVGGHALLEGVPGLGKTLLVRTLSQVLDLAFNRIQFTPDLMPSDIIGTNIITESGEGRRVFSFQPGPIFAQIVLADEINRATPRTQSALLEAMSDRQVSMDGQTWPLGPPFLVLATQNPYEFEGTYPLPESQLDRFMLRCRIGYPDRAAEKQILARHRDGEPVDQLKPVISGGDVAALQQVVRQVRVDDSLSDYILDLVEATRRHADVYLGGSTRAALSLYRAAQARALLDGRDFVVPDDIKCLTPAVLCHRVLAKSFRQGCRSDAADALVADIVGRTPVPT